jgi:hypothetical protein
VSLSGSVKVAFRIMLATATVKLLPFCGTFNTMLGEFVDVSKDDSLAEWSGDIGSTMLNNKMPITAMQLLVAS